MEQLILTSEFQLIFDAGAGTKGISASCRF